LGEHDRLFKEREDIKMQITLNNGKKISGETWEEIVENLKNGTQFIELSAEDYMRGTARRVIISGFGEMNYQDAESFIKELERLEIITIEAR
jgi:hypothetical protein